MSSAYDFFRESSDYRRMQLLKQGLTPESHGERISSVSLDAAVACAFAVTEMAVVNIAEWSLRGSVSDYLPHLDDAAEIALKLRGAIANGHSMASIVDKVEQLHITITLIGWTALNDSEERAVVGRKLWDCCDYISCLAIAPSPLSPSSGSCFIEAGVTSIVADRAIERLAEQNVINMRPAAASEKLAYRFLVNYAAARLLSEVSGSCGANGAV